MKLLFICHVLSIAVLSIQSKLVNNIKGVYAFQRFLLDITIRNSGNLPRERFLSPLEEEEPFFLGVLWCWWADFVTFGQSQGSCFHFSLF